MALCTSNLPAVAVTPSEHFNTVTYTGTGSDNANTGVGFQPDLTWIKRRNAIDNHMVFDSVRGFNGDGDSLYLSANTSDAETHNDDDHIKTFDTNGFTVQGGSSRTNNASQTYVAWNWKANGSGSANTVGDLDSTVSVNADAGISIVSWEATGSAASIGHGLGSTPDMFIVKNRDASDHWRVWHTSLTGAAGHLDLNRTNAEAAGGSTIFPSAPSSTVINVSTDQSVGHSGHDMIAYCFKSVDGYSKMGTYTGNGDADGTFVYTGFKPAYVMIKAASRADKWKIQDSTRNTYNPVTETLSAESSAATDSGDSSKWADFLSNGFKPRGTGGQFNYTDATYIYLAFAETPFKYSNAR
jgi:hypothetical protein